MTYPAWFDLHRDPVITRRPVAMRVYAAMVEDGWPALEPRTCRVGEMALRLGAKFDTVSEALSQLVMHGYLIEYDRGHKNTRRFTMVRSRSLPPNRGDVAA